MARPKVTVVFDKTRSILAGLKIVSSTRVLAGVPAEKNPRKDEENYINNAELMFIHEFGAPEAHIPPRPVVRPAIKSIRKEIIAILRKISLFALQGSPKKAEQGFHAMGILAQNAMRKRITEGPFIPLSPRTIANRRSRGRKGVKPLIDTGQLRRALTYVIRRK